MAFGLRIARSKGGRQKAEVRRRKAEGGSQRAKGRGNRQQGTEGEGMLAATRSGAWERREGMPPKEAGLARLEKSSELAT